MTKFLLIRHGQSEANLQSQFAGHLDTPPTELGLQQAAITGKYVAEAYKVDAVYSSDLKRAAAVGEAVSRESGAPLTLDPRLREIQAGQWEGVSFDELDRSRPSYQVWRSDIGSACCDGGETVAQLQARFVDAIKDIAKAHPGQTVVITTHATPIRTVQCFCKGEGLSAMQSIPWVSNASVTELYCDGDVMRLGRVAYDGHLGTLVSSLPKNV